MRSIRKLYFKNAAGDRFDLNGKNGAYAKDLAGFGISLSPSFSNLGRGFFQAVDDTSEPQIPLAFCIVLTRDPYDEYQRLVDWVSAAGTLTIVYDPTGKQEYCRDVTVRFIEKGELNQAGWLELLCSFACTTPWYLPIPTIMRISASAQDSGKRYDYTYGEDLRYGPDSVASMSAVIANSGHVPGALRLTFRGAVTNPQLRLVGNVSGRTIGMCDLSVALTDTDTLEFSSQYDNSYVKKISAAGVETDLIDVLDLRLSPFFHIPVDEPCTLSVEADADFSGYAELTAYYYFRSV